jgi:hypothetical protein
MGRETGALSTLVLGRFSPVEPVNRNNIEGRFT